MWLTPGEVRGKQKGLDLEFAFPPFFPQFKLLKWIRVDYLTATHSSSPLDQVEMISATAWLNYPQHRPVMNIVAKYPKTWNSKIQNHPEMQMRRDIPCVQVEVWDKMSSLTAWHWQASPEQTCYLALMTAPDINLNSLPSPIAEIGQKNLLGDAR